MSIFFWSVSTCFYSFWIDYWQKCELKGNMKLRCKAWALMSRFSPNLHTCSRVEAYWSAASQIWRMLFSCWICVQRPRRRKCLPASACLAKFGGRVPGVRFQHLRPATPASVRKQAESGALRKHLRPASSPSAWISNGRRSQRRRDA